MTRTFEEMCAERDPLYAAMQPMGYFAKAIDIDTDAAECMQIRGLAGVILIKWQERDRALLALTIRALRNQGEPYYFKDGQR